MPALRATSDTRRPLLMGRTYRALVAPDVSVRHGRCRQRIGGERGRARELGATEGVDGATRCRPPSRRSRDPVHADSPIGDAYQHLIVVSYRHATAR
jgi:hypothetical protein